MKLRIAIQKSGRLYEDSVQLLKECGIALRNVKDRLKTEADNFPWKSSFCAMMIFRNTLKMVWPILA
jgi:ATP phosphoribosyltransferase